MFAFMPWKVRRNEISLLPELQARLDDFLAAHRQLPGRVEPDFIRLGHVLQGVYAEAEAGSRRTRETIGLLGIGQAGQGQEYNAVDELRRLSADSLRELSERRREIADNLDVITMICQRLGKLREQGETLRKLGLYLGVVGLNIGVESTRSAAILELFAGIAPELRQVARQIHLVAEEISDDCRREQRDQQLIGRSTVVDLNQLASLVREAEKAVADTLDQIGTITGQALSALAEAERHGSEIAAQLGRVVMGVQLHDSMSQRIAHIVEALEIVRADFQGLAHEQDSLLRRQKMAVAKQIVELQGEQLGWIIKETVKAREESSRAFLVIDDQVRLLAQSLDLSRQSTAEEPAKGKKGDTTLGRLCSALEHLEGLVAQSDAMIERLNAGARRTVEMTGRLAKHMKNIEKIRQDVHLKALNTIVKASHLGEEGRSMEVLAQETKKLSDLAHEFVGEVGGLHRDIGDSVRRLRMHDETGLAASGPQGRSLREISQTLELFNSRAATVGKQAKVVGNGLEEAGECLTFLDRLIADLENDRQQLVAIKQLIDPFVSEVAVGFAGETAIQLGSLYTMEKEREMHQAILGQFATGPADDDLPPQPVQEPQPDDNIELF